VLRCPVEFEINLGGKPQLYFLPYETPDERLCVFQRLLGGFPLGLVSENAEVNPGILQVGGYVNPHNRNKSEPRVLQLFVHDIAYLSFDSRDYLLAPHSHSATSLPLQRLHIVIYYTDLIEIFNKINYFAEFPVDVTLVFLRAYDSQRGFLPLIVVAYLAYRYIKPVAQARLQTVQDHPFSLQGI